MIPLRSRLLGALVAGLALASGAQADQRPVVFSPQDSSPIAFGKLNANDAELYAALQALQSQVASLPLISGRIAALQAGTLDGVTIGGVAPGAAYFTTLSVTGGITGNASSASQLASARTLSLSGDATCSFSFDGSANAGCTVALSASGASAGTYGSATAIPVVTVDAKGRITGISTATNSGGTGVPTARQVLTGGLATGGGDLSADRTITVPTASQSDVATGTDTTKALTPYSVAAALAGKAPLTPIGQARLVYSSATALLVKPYQGNLVTINGAAQAVPSGGVPCSSTGIAAGTLTYEYLWMNGAAMACEVSTTGHVTSSNGVEVKSGDPTRTLVGMAYLPTAATFVDGPAQRFVASWFNRQDRALSVTAGSYQTASTSLTELSTAQRVSFLTWADEAPDLQTEGSISGALNATVTLALMVDGAAQGSALPVDEGTAGFRSPVLKRARSSLAEGVHTASPYGSVSNASNSGTFNLQTGGVVRN